MFIFGVRCALIAVTVAVVVVDIIVEISDCNKQGAKLNHPIMARISLITPHEFHDNACSSERRYMTIPFEEGSVDIAYSTHTHTMYSEKKRRRQKNYDRVHRITQN